MLLEENEIDTSEEDQLNSILCDMCNAWYHYKCENINANDFDSQEVDWVCSACLVSLACKY